MATVLEFKEPDNDNREPMKPGHCAEIITFPGVRVEWPDFVACALCSGAFARDGHERCPECRRP